MFLVSLVCNLMHRNGVSSHYLCRKVEIHPKQASLWSVFFRALAKGKLSKMATKMAQLEATERWKERTRHNFPQPSTGCIPLPSPTHTQTFPFKEAKPVFRPMLVGAGEPRLVVYKTGL